MCVRVGEDETAQSQTMSECETGPKHSKGEKVSVSCLAWLENAERMMLPFDQISLLLFTHQSSITLLKIHK